MDTATIEPPVKQINSGVVTSIIQDGNAERVKAEADYHAIAFDASRNSDQDKADLATAMRILGKTHNDVRAEQQAVVESRELYVKASGHPEAQKAKEYAYAAESEFHRVTKPTMLAEIDRMETEFRAKRDAAEDKEVKIMVALLALRRHRLKHGPLRAKGHLANEPVGSPAEIRIRGDYYRPADGVNPATGI
jgi:hypothetical protein